MMMMGRNFGRRTVALFWCGIVALVSGILIYLQQIPLLYVIATISLVILLLIVAFSDLENVGRDMIDES